MIEYILKYWVEFFFAMIVSTLSFGYQGLIKRMKEGTERQEAIEQGVLAILRDRIIAAYNHYMEKGYCPIYAMENITELYTQYHALGGNGTITALLERIKELPTEKAGE